jgi:hypothetical protein
MGCVWAELLGSSSEVDDFRVQALVIGGTIHNAPRPSRRGTRPIMNAASSGRHIPRLRTRADASRSPTPAARAGARRPRSVAATAAGGGVRGGRKALAALTCMASVGSNRFEARHACPPDARRADHVVRAVPPGD